MTKERSVDIKQQSQKGIIPGIFTSTMIQSGHTVWIYFLSVDLFASMKELE